MNVNEIILTRAIEDLRACKVKLETEESGNEIAFTQGKIKGYGLIIDFIDKDIPGTEADPDYVEKIDLEECDNDTITALHRDMERTRNRWGAIDERIDIVIDDEKTFLFWSAKKGRDLFVSHGKRNALLIHRKFFNAIQKQIERRISSQPLILGNYEIKYNYYDIEITDDKE